MPTTSPLLSYALKRIVRSWKLFTALILGMTLAATFFGGINVGADTIGRQLLDQQLANTPVDITLGGSGSIYGGQGSITIPASQFETVAAAVRQVDGVVSAETRGRSGLAGFNVTTGPMVAIPDSSLLYQHLTMTAGQRPAAANETLVNSNSPIANQYSIGTVLKYQISPYGANTSISLKIAGFASPDSLAANILGISLSSVQGSSSVPALQSVLVVSWENTFRKIVNWAYNQNQSPRPIYDVYAFVDVNLDRNRLLSPFDIEGSASRVAQIEAQISNIAAQNRLGTTDYLLPRLLSFAPGIASLRLTFVVFSIPVFFMAWYVGRTVSQASYNLRRREIGLLLTKGFSRTQLFRHFLVEALIVGLVSGLFGLAAAFALNPYFVQLLSGSYQGAVYLSTETAAITVVFAVVLTFLSILSPARQASSLDPALALREYVYVEDVQTSRKRGAILAFLLGLYKIILLLLGLNFVTLGRYATVAGGGGFFLFFIIVIMTVLDFGLTFLGPFLFLYGATQLSTGLSVRFHKAFSALSQRLVGDIASLAARSVFRNPRRVASLVFLVALIAGYSIWVVGDLASMEDFNVRQAEARVGSDIRVSNLGPNASIIASRLATWRNITGATAEEEIGFNLASSQTSIRVRAIDPLTWRDAAYFEPEWFSGDINPIFQVVASDSHTVIMDHGLASYFGISIGGNLTIGQSPIPLSLRVVGLFGPDYSQVSQPGILQPGGFSSFYPQGWSYVPKSLAEQFPSTFRGTNSTLVKVKPGVSLPDLAKSIQKAYPSANIQTAQVGEDTTGGVLGGALNVLRLGTVFAGAAACIGVGAVTYTGFKEREKETTMIAVRGLSYRQLLGLLVTEVLPLVVFALILATAVGLITVRGDTLALTSLNPNDYYSLLSPRRVVFPYNAQLTLLIIIGLLLLGVFLPAIAFARKDLSRMSRTVRFA